jgi:hypothetical protein
MESGGTQGECGEPSTDLTRAERAFDRWWRHYRAVSLLLVVLGVVMTAAGWRILSPMAAHCSDFHTAIGLAGTSARLQWILAGCSTSPHTLGPLAANRLLVGDIALILGYFLLSALIIRAGWWRFEAEVMRQAWWVLWLPAAAAGVDLVEDGLLRALLRDGDDGQLRYVSDGWARSALLTVSWTKWMLLLALVVVTVLAAAVTVTRWSEHFPPPRRRGGVLVNADTTAAQMAAGADPKTTDPGVYVDRRRAIDRPRPHLDDPELGRGDSGEVPISPGEDQASMIGVCVSGGGIRSAAFALGVLSELDTNAGSSSDTAPLGTARYLTAVSGGAWAATIWTLQKVQRPGENAAETVIERMQQDVASGYQRQKYLMNGRGGILGPLWWILMCACVNLAYIGSLIYLIAWPLGWFAGGCAISGRALGPTWCGPPFAGFVSEGTLFSVTAGSLPDQLVMLAPAGAFAILGCTVLAVCGSGGKRLASGWRIGVLLLGLSAFSALYLVMLPVAFALMGTGRVSLTALSSAVGASAALTVIGGVWKVIGGPVLHQVTGRLGRLAPKLLGLVLALGAIAWTLVVMYGAAQETLPFWTMAGAAGAVLVLAVLCSPNWPTLHSIFAVRLRRSFDPVAYPLDSGRPDAWQPTWASLDQVSQPRSGATVPELVLCCAQQRNGLAAGGLRAETFTVSPRWVRQGNRSMPTTSYLRAADSVTRPTLNWPKRRKEYERFDRPSGWLATTGAAFSSAMGRASLGSTNAFMAAINADLGMWLPNVRLLQVGGDAVALPTRYRPRPRLGYLFKEILGVYSLDDRYVFITDGGHWDNLGLVELLRRRCDTIFCIDASGDPPGSFATLRETLNLASLELGFALEGGDLDHVLRDVLPRAAELPATAVATLTLSASDPGEAEALRRVTVNYVKLQATRDMTVDLRRYAIADPKFPTYSTLQQFLTPQQFANLVATGRHAGGLLAAAARQTRPGADVASSQDR